MAPLATTAIRTSAAVPQLGAGEALEAGVYLLEEDDADAILVLPRRSGGAWRNALAMGGVALAWAAYSVRPMWALTIGLVATVVVTKSAMEALGQTLEVRASAEGLSFQSTWMRRSKIRELGPDALQHIEVRAKNANLVGKARLEYAIHCLDARGNLLGVIPGIADRNNAIRLAETLRKRLATIPAVRVLD
jgi:hypothetical protein